MAFISGLILIDAPASALNNSEGEKGIDRNKGNVKAIYTKEGVYPYVSAQSFRYWLRTTLENDHEWSQHASPVFRKGNLAYTDGDPIRYWDDDLFGYMRAQSGGENEFGKQETSIKGKSITRTSPLRTSTLVAISPVKQLTKDFGSMTRLSGNPVLYEHEFYRAILKGLFSLDLKAAGTFSYRDKSGFRNLDNAHIDEAKAKLEHLEDLQSYRLDIAERTKRVSHLLRGFASLQGGAKQAIHYTDVTPVVLIAAVLEGGNNPMHYVIGAGAKGVPEVNTEALYEMLNVWDDQLNSKLYIGWVRGFHEEQRELLVNELRQANVTVNDLSEKLQQQDVQTEGDSQSQTSSQAVDKADASKQALQAVIGHPRQIFTMLAEDVMSSSNYRWFGADGNSQD